MERPIAPFQDSEHDPQPQFYRTLSFINGLAVLLMVLAVRDFAECLCFLGEGWIKSLRKFVLLYFSVGFPGHYVVYRRYVYRRWTLALL